MNKGIQELESFIENWTETQGQNKKAFIRLKDYVSAMPGVHLDFISRPGVTHSLRANHKNQENRPLFLIMDVVEERPRWLSVCFYSETINDPEDRGVFVPKGLLDEDAICFDVEEYDETLVRYLEARFDEAHQQAAQG
jgi:hypothetical protein